MKTVAPLPLSPLPSSSSLLSWPRYRRLGLYLFLQERLDSSGGVMYFVFARMPGESYRRRLRSLLYLCCVFRALINSLELKINRFEKSSLYNWKLSMGGWGGVRRGATFPNTSRPFLCSHTSCSWVIKHRESLRNGVKHRESLHNDVKHRESLHNGVKHRESLHNGVKPRESLDNCVKHRAPSN